jgi:hypothetical protein
MIKVYYMHVWKYNNETSFFFTVFKEIFFIINNLLTKKLWGMYGIISKF